MNLNVARYHILLLFAVVQSFVTIGVANETDAVSPQKVEAKVSLSGEGQEVEGVSNKRLKNEAGSASQWSLSSKVDYLGGTVADPLASHRPDIHSGGVGSPVAMSFDGKVRYRWSASDSFTLGTGLGIYQPFHGSLSSVERLSDNLNVSNIDLGYHHLAKVGAWQSLSAVLGTIASTEGSLSTGLIGSVLVQQTFLRGDWPIPRLTLGFSMIFGASAYRSGALESWRAFRIKTGGLDPNADVTEKDLARNQLSHQGLLGPFVEYRLSDIVSLRSVIASYFYRTNAAQSPWDINVAQVYQSFGVGLAPTRDLYFYPHIKFIPSDLRSENTVVAVSASMNFF